MSSISRLDKYVVETARLKSLNDAAKRRNQPICIVIGMNEPQKTAVMSRAATALALRSLKGPVKIYFQGSSWHGSPLLAKLRDDFCAEAELCGAADRLNIDVGVPHNGHSLHIGTNGVNGISVDAYGWTASINSNIQREQAAVAPAAIFAVCCGFAKLFSEAVIGNASQGKERWDFSLMNFSRLTQNEQEIRTCSNLNLGRIGLLGAGAIGAGFMFALIMSGWSAKVDIIDDDRYEEPNLETTMLTSKKAVLDCSFKAPHLSSIGELNPQLVCRPIKKRISGDSEELSQFRNLLVCTVDNTETRRILDSANVEAVLNGATGGTRLDSGHVLYSRHKRAVDPPLKNLYSVEGKEENTNAMDTDVPLEVAHDECSRIAYKGVSLAAPFMGLAVGSLLLAGCAHRVINAEPSINYLKLDLMGLQSKYQSELKKNIATY